jgi:hypothetical protein
MHYCVVGMLYHSSLTNLWHSWRTAPPLVAIKYLFNWSHNKLKQPDSGSVPNSLILCTSKTTLHSTFPTKINDVQEQWNHKNYAAQIYFVYA